jgi:hypothetical protein
MKEAAVAANKATQQSGVVSECLRGADPIFALDSLSALIDSIEHGPTNYFSSPAT